jgi:hypothetical protein
MELASLFLLILLPPADATGETATAVTSSLRRELGDVALALAPDSMVTPAMWQGEKAPMRATFVVRVVWQEKDKASIELLSASSSPAVKGFRGSRDLAFAAEDSKGERGRAIGLVVAELLRESPASALVPASAGAVRAAGADSGPPSHVAVGGMLASERVRAGTWAMGPKLTYDFGLSEALRLQVSGTALFSSADQYNDIGGGVGIFWDFLHSERGRHALGIGLGLDGLRESASGSGDYAKGASGWSVAAGAGLGGRVTVWRNLRVTGDFVLRATSRTMTLTVGDESYPRQYSFSRWRPGFALGLAYAL